MLQVNTMHDMQMEPHRYSWSRHQICAAGTSTNVVGDTCIDEGGMGTDKVV